MEIKTSISAAIKILNNIEEYDNSLASELSLIDMKLCDLLHLIENNNLKTNQCYRVVKEMHKLRVERRKIKNDMELMKVFRDNKNKLLIKEHRQFLMNDIYNKDKRINSTYKNRVYSEEEIKEMIGF